MKRKPAPDECILLKGFFVYNSKIIYKQTTSLPYCLNIFLVTSTLLS